LLREADDLWRVVTRDWLLDEAALAVLATACRALTQDLQAAALVAKEGLVVRDRWGQAKPNPAVAIRRDAQSTFLRAMKELGLDLEPVGPVGRPPGK
jgi:phage terminase small subunit